MRGQIVNKLSTLARAQQRTMSNAVGRAGMQDMVRKEHLQFSKGMLTEFGDLPLGSVPTSLRYSRDVNTSVLSNGVRVCTEAIGSTGLVGLSLTIKAGSR